MPDTPTDGLNPDQLDAVVHGDGPLLVVAGAGSGKTRVLTHRIAHLVHEGVHPSRILAITFTNKAADEMKSRVAALVGPVAEKMWVSTFHSACVRSTLHGAFTRGYDTTLVSDAHTTEDLTQWGAPPPEQVISHTNLYWSFQEAPGRTAEVVPAADVTLG